MALPVLRLCKLYGVSKKLYRFYFDNNFVNPEQIFQNYFSAHDIRSKFTIKRLQFCRIVLKLSPHHLAKFACLVLAVKTVIFFQSCSLFKFLRFLVPVSGHKEIISNSGSNFCSHGACGMFDDCVNISDIQRSAELQTLISERNNYSS